jgi:neutral ceramidase
MKLSGSRRRLSTLARHLFLMFLAAHPAWLPAQTQQPEQSPLLSVGMGRRDITPDYPVRLSGYGSRREPHKGVAQRIHAKALAFGEDSGDGPALLLTVDNCGIPAWIRTEIHRRISVRFPLKDERFAVCSSHTHCAPMVSGILPNLFGLDLPAEHQAGIDRYTGDLIDAMEQVALEALASRRPSRMAWGVGSVPFAANRRKFPNRPVDHALPLLRITDTQGSVTALLTSYACHCTTIGIDKIHGDWAGCAQEALEREFPGAIALTAIGCGADQNPSPRSTPELAVAHGESLAAEASRLARSTLLPLSHTPEGRTESIQLAFDTLPTREEWQLLAGSSSTAVAYHARKNISRLDGGDALPTSIPYLVQTWTFGDDLAMVFLPGEVVVDYSIRLKTEFDHRRMWVNGYSNDVPAYIPSKRILEEGGYEGGGAMMYYDRPTRFAPDVEGRIISAVRNLVPPSFLTAKTPKPPTEGNAPSPFVPGNPRLTLSPHLYAVSGEEWNAFPANTILAEAPKNFRFEVDCPVGKREGNRWSIPAGAAQAGEYPFRLRLLDSANRAVAVSSSTLHVSPAQSGASRTACTVLVVGDSLTAGGIYPDEIARLFARPGNPTLHMLGTQTRRPSASTLENVAHEGFGGWTWKGFLTRYDPGEPEPGKTNKSPFVFATAEPPGSKADVQRYLRERCGGRVPDFITVLLGINDCFGLKADQPTALDKGITEMLLQAENLLLEFRKAAPDAVIGICLVPPPNDREGAFVANYKDQYPRWNWKQVQHRIVERQLQHFFGREKEKVELVPVGLGLDTWSGYPEGNAVHPNEKGSRQIGASIYAWMKHHLARRESAPPNP